MYLRICENIAEIAAILLISMAYILCLQQVGLIEPLPVPNISWSNKQSGVDRGPGVDRLVSAACRKPASKSPSRRIVLV